MKNPLLFRAVTLVGLSLVTLAVAGQYSVVMERLPNEQMAQSRLDSLTASGFAPVFLETRSGELCVEFGRFSTAAEAHWYSKELKLRGYFTEVVQPATPGETALTVSYPYEKIAKLDTIPNAPDVVLNRDSDARIAEFWAIKDSGDLVAARQKVLQILNNAPQGEPIAGWAILTLAYLDCKEGKKDEAIKRFKMLADGNVAASKAHRIEALYRYAYLLARNKLRVDAAEAFREVTRIASNPEVKVDAFVQLAGKEVELARDGIVTYDEAREACRKVLEVAAPEQRPARATAELMYAETYAYHSNNPSHNLGRAMDLFKMVVQEYADQRRESGMASYWVSFCHRCKAEYEDAKVWARKVVDMNLRPDELFTNVNLPARAMLDLAVLEHWTGNEEASREWAKRLKTEFGGSKEAGKVDGALVGYALEATVLP